MMVASSVVLTVVVLNYHHRTAETHEMPVWVKPFRNRLPRDQSCKTLLFFCFKMGHSRYLFLYFRLFYTQLKVNKCSIKVADDWIWTWVLWYWRRPLCQLRHNHCPPIFFFFFHVCFNDLSICNNTVKILGKQIISFSRQSWKLHTRAFPINDSNHKLLIM